MMNWQMIIIKYRFIKKICHTVVKLIPYLLFLAKHRTITINRFICNFFQIKNPINKSRIINITPLGL